MRHHFAWIALAALLTSAGPATPVSAQAQAESPKEAQAASAAASDPLVVRGAALFQRYCASCHGAQARGDGPVAPSLRTPPPDLTRIEARRSGQFPAGDIASWIDGRFQPGAHGSREMPVWGIALRNDLPRTGLEQEIVRGQIDMLVDYLRTLQRGGD